MALSFLHARIILTCLRMALQVHGSFKNFTIKSEGKSKICILNNDHRRIETFLHIISIKVGFSIK
jgi:hypothetical protein